MSCFPRSARWRGPVALIGLAAALAPAAAPAGSTPPAPQERAIAAQAPSAFDGYRRFADSPPRDWREANDTVGRIGGWRAYAREAQGAADGPAPAGHGGHNGHNGHSGHGSHGAHPTASQPASPGGAR